MLGFGGQTMSAEVASYLIPLLDAEKDKHEIETLKDRTATLGKLPYLSLPSRYHWPMGSPQPTLRHPTRG